MKKHMSLIDRKAIETALNQGMSLGSIAKCLERSPSTISREIRRNAEVSLKGCYGRVMNCCVHRRDCDIRHLCNDVSHCRSLCSRCDRCNSVCPDFEEELCPRLLLPPYVCNGCDIRNRCTLKKRFYKGKSAHFSYEKRLRENRTGFNLSPQELRSIDAFFSPLIMQGLSLYSITHQNRDSVPCSESTARRLLGAGVLEARNADLPRSVRFKKRKGKKRVLKVDRKCREGRMYQDFLNFVAQNPDLPVSEVDSVIGSAGGKVLLTVILRNCSLMLAFLRDKNTALSVKNIFSGLYDLLGADLYGAMFRVILTDNGSEFSDPTGIEFSDNGVRKTFVFYCNPQAPQEKPLVENNHTLIRRILPKGASFDDLSQDDVDLMMSHINSYGRAKYNGRSPAEIFISLYGIDALHLLRQRLIPPREICLTKKLISKM